MCRLRAHDNHPESTPQKVRRPASRFYDSLKEHSNWPLTQTLQKLEPQDRAIVRIIVSKELGHFPQDHRIFNDFGLGTSVGAGPAGLRHVLTKLRKGSALRTEKLIRPCGGMPPGALEEDDALLRVAEFELTSACRKALGIQRRPEHLLDDWGLREIISYGHGTTLLFTGPPGVGKTAADEAFARALDKSILAIDYAALQSCWVGETEKNVVRAFREVNVQLKEIEAFSGVCILAINRSIHLAPPTPSKSALPGVSRFRPPTHFGLNHLQYH